MKNGTTRDIEHTFFPNMLYFPQEKQQLPFLYKKLHQHQAVLPLTQDAPQPAKLYDYYEEKGILTLKKTIFFMIILSSGNYIFTSWLKILLQEKNKLSRKK